jgi:hypothetical protein
MPIRVCDVGRCTNDRQPSPLNQFLSRCPRHLTNTRLGASMNESYDKAEGPLGELPHGIFAEHKRRMNSHGITQPKAGLSSGTRGEARFRVSAILHSGGAGSRLTINLQQVEAATVSIAAYRRQQDYLARIVVISSRHFARWFS